MRFEQTGEIYDVPVTIAVTYADGKTSESVVIVNDAVDRGSVSRSPGTVAIGRSKSRTVPLIAIIEKKK